MPESNIPCLYFQKWKIQKGDGTIVVPKKFISYIGSKFKMDGEYYIGQKWKCKMPNGTLKNLNFRVPYIEDEDYVDSNKKSFLIDYSLNPIIHTPEQIENPDLLFNEEEKFEDEKLLKALSAIKNEKLIEGRDLFIKFLKSPDIKSLKNWQKWKKAYSKQFTWLIHEKNKNL